MERVDKMKSFCAKRSKFFGAFPLLKWLRKTHCVTPKVSHVSKQYRMDWNSWKEIKNCFWFLCALVFLWRNSSLECARSRTMFSTQQRWWEEKVGNYNRKIHISHSKLSWILDSIYSLQSEWLFHRCCGMNLFIKHFQLVAKSYTLPMSA